MQLTRRDALQWLGLGTAGLTLSSCKLGPLIEAIAHRPMRRDIETLANDDEILQTFRQGVQLMKALPSSDRRNWARQAKIHDDHCPHRNWLFLPWHRAYIFHFEQIIRTLTGKPKFALPYWNWSRNRRIPAAFWGAGNPLAHGSRVATASSVANETSVGCTRLEGILKTTAFQTFGSTKIRASDGQRTAATAGVLESGPHNYIHGTFVLGTMATFKSPEDPLFWAHHGMVEACWFEWNLNRGFDNPDESAWLDRTFTDFCDGDGNQVTDRVGDMTLLPVLSYQYDELYLPCAPPPAPPPPPPPAASPAPRPKRLRYSTDTQAEADAAKAHVQKGADSTLRTLETIAAVLAAPLDVRDRAQLTIAIPPEKRAAVRATGPDRRALVTVEIESVEHPEEGFVRVFAGAPEAAADTPVSDPHDAGMFAFFGHDHAEHGGSLRFVLDLTAVAARTDGDLALTFVVVPRSDVAEPRTIARISAVTLGIAETVVPSSTR